MKTLALAIALAISTAACSKSELRVIAPPQLATSSAEGRWTNYPRRPYADMDIFVDGSYLIHIANPSGFGYSYPVVTCKDTLGYISPSFFFEGIVDPDGKFSSSWEDTLTAINVYSTIQGTVTDSLIEIRQVITTSHPCNADDDEMFWLRRSR